MKNISFLALLLLTLLFIPASANAGQLSARQLHDVCVAEDKLTKEVCLFYTSGILDSFVSMVAIEDSNKTNSIMAKNSRICVANYTLGQITRKFLNDYESTPTDYADMTGALAFSMTLYKCSLTHRG
jgi:hypothetical protein